MASIKDFYKKAFLSATNLGKTVLRAKIIAAYPETVSDGKKAPSDKIIIELDDEETRICLNKGNAFRLMKDFGDDYEQWVGKKVVVSSVPTSYMGKPCMGVNVVGDKKK